jgi:hypothetical protein
VKRREEKEGRKAGRIVALLIIWTSVVIRYTDSCQLNVVKREFYVFWTDVKLGLWVPLRVACLRIGC